MFKQKLGSNEKGDLDLTDKSNLLHRSGNEWYLLLTLLLRPENTLWIFV